ncbi:MAG: UvrD-helicase domain-containing protein [Lachnospiraceae bacterium]|nr:UvrD-helicase domain-containing protein [Lachnospiraceae bacterium]
MNTNETYNQNVKEFNNAFVELLNQDKYIARSDYKFLVENFQKTYNRFLELKESEMLAMYCEKNNMSIDTVKYFIEKYEEIKNLKEDSKMITNHNEKFIKEKLINEKSYLDNILKSDNPNIILDENQRKVVLSDEDYTLVIAGAGTGKTTTVEAKVKYLVDKKGIKPEEILVISFTNKAVEELKKRIVDKLKIPCRISTFHSLGYMIANNDAENKKTPVTEGYLYVKINEYLKKYVLGKKDKVDELIKFFAMYIDAPYSENDIKKIFEYIENADFKTLKSYIGEYKVEFIDKISNQKRTINNEILRSYDEVKIANFLYLNSIDYEYEKISPISPVSFQKSKKLYTPDFYVKQGDKECWIEHFGMINEDDTSEILNDDSIYKYIKEKNDKIRAHKNANLDLICTFHKYNDGDDCIKHLKKELSTKGFEFNKRDSEEVYKKFVDCCESKYIDKFAKLIMRFINNFKSRGWEEKEFKTLKTNNKLKSGNVRNDIFLNICESCYSYYQDCLREEHKLDFQDMINESTRVLDNLDVYKSNLNYRYIFVDEYQDISLQRFDLTKELSKVCDAKIIAVGDDWQSIYAFSGSDIDCFLNFKKMMGYSNEIKIENTYRNSQELIDIAGGFIQENKKQIRKTLYSPKRIDKPIIIETYKDVYDKNDRIKDKNYYLGMVVDHILGEIVDKNIIENKKSNEILLIGRFGFDAYKLVKFSDLFEYNESNKKMKSKTYPFLDLTFLTAHSSKGLSYDNVIIINAENGLYGFPSQKESDPIMKMVTKIDNSFDKAEERRLFYVALTRTKNRVYIAAPQNKPSKFIIELINNYSNIESIGRINLEVPKENAFRVKYTCPVCGFPLQRQWNKNYGLELYICTNEPELCGFMTNQPNCKTLQIHKCDKCQNGYLIVKKKENYFLGCTNYNTMNCNNTISERNYKSWVEGKNTSIVKKDGFNKKLAASIDLKRMFNKLDNQDK